MNQLQFLSTSRKTLLTVVFFAVQLASITSCKKEHKVVCKLRDITGTSATNQQSITFNYNSDGTVLSMITSGTNPSNAYFMYKHNAVIILRFAGVPSTFRETDSLTFNSAGFVTNLRDYLKEDKSLWLNWNYEFGAANRINKFVLTSSAYSRIVEGLYTYANGNIIQKEATTFGYDTTRTSAFGDFHSFTLLLAYGRSYNQCKNLVTSQVNGSDTTFYRYMYDAAGNISEMDFVHKGVVTNQYKYAYTCE